MTKELSKARYFKELIMVKVVVRFAHLSNWLRVRQTSKSPGIGLCDYPGSGRGFFGKYYEN